jgi:hypothetical protein
MGQELEGRPQPPTSQTEGPAGDTTSSEGSPDWLKIARGAYRASTNYFDANYRKMFEDGIRAFNNQHPTDSKYNAPAYDKRSKLYRPKIRSVIRKNEAAAAAAFFSNMDVVSVSAGDQTDKAQIASAEINKELMQYRLTKTIPWFQTVLGGLQDAQTVGAAVAHIYWDTSDKDIPCVDLLPIENFRFDPSASWIDPVNTSPYCIQCIPMYAMDVKAKMNSGEWFRLEINIAQASNMDSTRVARNTNKEDPMSQSARGVTDYDIVWVQRHIHRREGVDWDFYTLGEHSLLSEPVPLKETTFHGRRPYVMGCCILETHKVIPSGVPQLGKGLADETNEIANSRIDNVKFALNKKWFAKRGVDVDLAGLVRNVPGGIVLMNDPINDVREVTWPDVTGSSYQEQQNINLDMDELLGNFNPAGLMMNGAGNAPARNMALTNQANGTLVEYLIRVYVETFVQPVLRHLVLLEQHYETDTVILGLCAKKAQLYQRFGVDQITDELLNQEVTLTVNVGMGATDPTQKLQKFLAAFTAYSNALKNPTPGVNMVEVGKEIFGHLGYSDGSRFFTVDDPQVISLQGQLQQAQQIIQQLQAKIAEKNTAHQVGIMKNRETQQTKLAITNIQEANENKRALATHYASIHKAMTEDGQRRTVR